MNQTDSYDDRDRVMIDIETLGLDPGAAILSIGACRFELGRGWLRDEFYTEISVDSNTDHGLRVDDDTLDWWRDQDEGLAPLDGDAELDTALEDLRAWLGDPDELWANSPKFDMAMLEYAYDAVGQAAPWEYYQLRDVRTVRSMPGAAELEMEGREHHALDDARHQADEVAETLNQMGVVQR